MSVFALKIYHCNEYDMEDIFAISSFIRQSLCPIVIPSIVLTMHINDFWSGVSRGRNVIICKLHISTITVQAVVLDDK